MTPVRFPPTRADGLHRLADFAPRAGHDYAVGRNSDEGPDQPSHVSMRSPYPAPIVDNAVAAKAARDALYVIRKSADHKAAARKIVAKHGSRKTGMPMTGQKRRTKSKPVNDPQMALEF